MNKKLFTPEVDYLYIERVIVEIILHKTRFWTFKR